MTTLKRKRVKVHFYTLQAIYANGEYDLLYTYARSRLGALTQATDLAHDLPNRSNITTITILRREEPCE